jgi:hypothetical protein
MAERHGNPNTISRSEMQEAIQAVGIVESDAEVKSFLEILATTIDFLVIRLHCSAQGVVSTDDCLFALSAVSFLRMSHRCNCYRCGSCVCLQ